MTSAPIDPKRTVACCDDWTLASNPLELWRGGTRLRLQDLPLQMLDLLMRRPGELVTREEMTAHLWPGGVVDFDAGLNTALRKLRVALGDEADAPRYIETVPRQGYRFIGKLASTDAAPVPARPAAKKLWLAAAALLAGAIAFGVWQHPRPQHSPLAPAPYRVAVLPFENLSPDPANSFFADGMHEEVLGALANRARNLQVISRTTMMLYRATPKAVTEIGRELGVTHVLEGTVRREGENVRVSLQLVDAREDRQVWMQTFDRKLTDAMTLQSEVANIVAGQLAVKLSPDLTRPAPPANPEAFDLWLRGKVYWQNVGVGGTTLQEVLRIEGMYTQAIALDPGYAAAYADRARVRINKFVTSLDSSPDNLAGARADLAKAQELAPGTPNVLVRQATLAYLVDQDMDQALTLIAQAGKVAPLNADHLLTKAYFLGFDGQLEESLRLHALAARDDPGNPATYRFWANNLFAAHRPADALRILRDFELRLPGRITYGEPAFGYTGETARWRGEIEGMNRSSATGTWLSNEIELLRFEKDAAKIQAVLAATTDASFRERSAFGSLIGSAKKPVAELRGWELLRSGDRIGSARQGQILNDHVRAQARTPWNGWWLGLLKAEGSLFAGDSQLAIAEARGALALLPKKPNFAVSLYARGRAARILAWAGAADPAMDLLDGLAGGYPGMGPAAISRDPFYEMPLKDNARFRALQTTLEAQLAAAETWNLQR